MDSQRVEYILQKGEGLTSEFKRVTNALPNNLFETVCAFLIRQGGTLLLGVSDEENVPINVPLNDRMKYSIDRISTHKNIHVEELSIHFKVSEKLIKRDLAYLKKNKIIKHVRSKKTGYWQLIDQE